ncbi:MAG: hypothetical protein FNP40_04140 [Dehalobacter sp. 4CP]|nr:hypothetical protein [Dehalobacter sp. 4CP]
MQSRVFLLNSKNKVKNVELVSVGTLTASLVHSREIIQAVPYTGEPARS